MAFRWRTNDGPFKVVFGSTLPSSTKKQKKNDDGQLIVVFGPSLLSSTKIKQKNDNGPRIVVFGSSLPSSAKISMMARLKWYLNPPAPHQLNKNDHVLPIKVLGSSFPSSTRKTNIKKENVKVGPSRTKLSGYALANPNLDL